MKNLYLIIFTFISFSVIGQHNWTRTNPGGGGAIAEVGATKSGMIVVASDLSGIFRSYNDGETFDAVGVNQGIESTHTSALGFDPVDDQTFFVGTYIGLFKTSDEGDNFHFVFPAPSDPFETSYIEDVAISASNHNIGYLTHHITPDANGEVYKTTNGGESWNAVAGEDLPNNLHLVKLMVHPDDQNMVYALSGKTRWGCGPANLYRSTNGGINWTEIGAAQGDILDFDLHPSDPNTLYVSTFLSQYISNEQCQDLSFSGSGEYGYVVDDYLGGELYKSTDGGANFIQVSQNTGVISVHNNNPEIVRLVDYLYPYDWNDQAGSYESVNGGSSWVQTGTIQSGERGYSENQYFAYAGSFNGLSKTLKRDLFNPDRFYGSFGQWAWASFDSGITINNISTKNIGTDKWRSTGMENIVGHCLDVNESNPNVIYMGGYDIGFWRSTDHGESWTRSQPNYNTYPEYSWNLGTPGTIELNMATRGAGSNVMTLLNDPVRENVVWASFSRRQYTDDIEGDYAETSLFKSIDHGETWTLITGGLPSFENSTRMYGLSLDNTSPTNNRVLYLTVDNVVYKSINDGIDWLDVLSDKKVKFTEVDKYNGNIVYAGGSDGLWRSLNAGNSWTKVSTSAMEQSSENIREDIVPTWIDYGGPEILYPWEGVFDIQTDPNAANGIIITVHGPNGGVYKSSNAGTSWSTNLLPDPHMRGVAIAPFDSNVLYATSSKSYHSGGFGNSSGINYSTDGGSSWTQVNEGMAFNYGGMIEIETGDNPHVWAWAPGTGIQRSPVPQDDGIALDLNVFLQGPFDANTQLMSDELRAGGYLPLNEPYTIFGFNHVQGGAETTTETVFNSTGNNAIVDWIFVELRDPIEPTTIIATQSALLQRDGDIVGRDGVSSVVFNGLSVSSFFVAIRHRSHLGMRTANTYSISSPININFSSPSVPLYGDIPGANEHPMTTIGSTRVMIAAEANGDGQVNSVDRNLYWRPENAEPYHYYFSKADFSLNGYINADDKNNYWRINNAKAEFLD